MMKGLKIEIDQELCKGCKQCFKVCFEDVYRWDEVEGKPIVAYPDDCVMCLSCEEVCSAQCIDVIPPPMPDMA